jgi:hypothetical protein
MREARALEAAAANPASKPKRDPLSSVQCKRGRSGPSGLMVRVARPVIYWDVLVSASAIAAARWFDTVAQIAA